MRIRHCQHLVCFTRNRIGCEGLADCEELVGVTHRGQWIWFYEVSFVKRIGKAGTKIKGLEENENGQANRSMVN